MICIILWQFVCETNLLTFLFFSTFSEAMLIETVQYNVRYVVFVFYETTCNISITDDTKRFPVI